MRGSGPGRQGAHLAGARRAAHLWAMTLPLTPDERAYLDGAHGEAGALAMRVVVAAAELLGASRLVEIQSAHIDGCLYHGDGGVEFAERLGGGGGGGGGPPPPPAGG